MGKKQPGITDQNPAKELPANPDTGLEKVTPQPEAEKGKGKAKGPVTRKLPNGMVIETY
jgi:hypothetical protein